MNESTINKLVQVIKNKKIDLDTTHLLFKDHLSKLDFDQFDRDHWCHYAFYDSICKLALMTDNNFNSIETFGLVSTTRYIFELSVRLTLISQDCNYGLVYYGQLLREQVSYWKSLKEQLDREVLFLNEIDKKERELLRVKLMEYSNIEDPKLKEKVGSTLAYDIMNTIDNHASRKFSIHAEQAKTNGYEFQAHLIERNELSLAKSSLAQVESEYAHFCSSVPQDVLTSVKNWNWKDKSKQTNHLEEYDYIYSFTSRMLHATPASITNTSKFLSVDEMVIFLKYINVKILDINALANTFLGRASKE